MAVTLEMATDVRKFKTKFIGPFTKRQAIFVSIGVICASPILPLPMDITAKVLICAGVCGGISAFGFISFNGAPLEALIIRFLYQFVLAPAKRKKKTKNSYLEYYEQLKKKEDIEYKKTLSKKELKEYEKAKKIDYSNHNIYL